MGTYRHKKTRNMKPFCRKTGGGQFRFTGKTRAPVAILGPQAKEPQLNIVATMLEKMGFRVGSR